MDLTDKNDSPTILSLEDTIKVLEKRKHDWKNDKNFQAIFAWNSGSFIESHVQEVCEANCPELLPLCEEYRTYKTIFGKGLDPYFGLLAINTVFEVNFIDLYESSRRNNGI